MKIARAPRLRRSDGSVAAWFVHLLIRYAAAWSQHDDIEQRLSQDDRGRRSRDGLRGRSGGCGAGGGVTPVDGGVAGGTTVPINDSPDLQLDPRVSGDLAVDTDMSQTLGQIRYLDFVNGVDQPFPARRTSTRSGM
jgi:hypothetical protein